MNTKPSYIYVNINKQTVALFFIANVLRISKYQLFLLYETFGDDCFLFFTIFSKAGLLPALTDFRLKRCFHNAEALTPVLLGKQVDIVRPLELRAYKEILPYCFENKIKLEEDQEAI